MHIFSKKQFWLIMAILLTTCGITPQATELQVMSFNIRWNNPDDGENAWPHRKQHVAGIIKNRGVDIVGLQEALIGQIEYLESALDDYAWFGIGRDDGEKAGEFTAIFYRKDRFDLLDEGTFWCSQTPDKPGFGWDAVCNRTATWGKFKDKNNGREFFLFNTHYDHVGKVAREKSARLLIERIKNLGDDTTVLVTGDFNCPPGSPPYKILTDAVLQDARLISVTDHQGPAGTFTGFNPKAEPSKPIDYIFVSPNVQVQTHAFIDQTFSGKLPSDHYPVLAKVRF